MKAIVQRVDHARINVDGTRISEIGKGILVLLGVEKGDAARDADYLLDKILHLRLFDDGEGKMNLSVMDVLGEMMVVSQFTLLADCRKGRRPSFIGAEDPDQARILYEYFLHRGKEKLNRVESGKFQAMMKVESINDGPVTLLLDSKRKFWE